MSFNARIAQEAKSQGATNVNQVVFAALTAVLKGADVGETVASIKKHHVEWFERPPPVTDNRPAPPPVSRIEAFKKRYAK